MEQLEQLENLVRESRSMVFFGGAGVSTESGIPDFRSVDGLYHQSYDEPPETILSHSFFLQHPDIFYRFYRDKMVHPDAQPNAAHRALAALEAQGKLLSVVTQNIDGLHQAAGSKKVWELHGSIHRNRCMECGRSFSLAEVLEKLDAAPLPRCACGGLMKPEVVLYEEALDPKVMEGAVRDISLADLLVIGGTSLAVYPAAGLLRYFRGDHIVVINRTPTPMDHQADLLITQPIGQVFSTLLRSE
ncbi:MAG: NAD-dependent protein deacylase [Eubacteriales bacterium]|nr:NAD-dependent protein deacylase [Eubacteriales bacterium]